MEAFLELFSGLSRQGPGSDVSTRRALAMLGPLPAAPKILDLGCGSGSSALVLARATGGRVTAVDLHQPFLDELKTAARARGLAHSIETRCVSMDAVSMDAIDDPPESFDLLWSEGAAYLMGFEYALSRWAPLLRKGGLLAVTEATWLESARPVEAMRFWAEAYPDMADVKSNLKALRRQGLEPIGNFTLPAEDWTAEYYDELRRNIERLGARADSWPELAEAIAATEREIEVFEKHGGSYGYVFYLARKA